VDVSWKKLEKRNSDLKKVLEAYRKSNTCCCDMILVLLIVGLMGLIIFVYRKKGYF